MSDKDFDLDALSVHTDAVNMINAFLDGIDSDVRVSEYDVDNYCNKNWRTVNFAKALSAMQEHRVKPTLRQLPMVPANGGGVIGRVGRGAAAILGLSRMAGDAFDRAGGMIASATDSIADTKSKAQKFAKEVNDAKKKMFGDQTNKGTSTGGGDRTEFTITSSPNLNYIPSEIPEVQSTRVVEIPNTMYPQVTVRPVEYNEAQPHRDRESAYLSTVQWRVPPDSEYAKNFWTNWVQRFQILAQMRSGFNVQANTLFTSDNLTSYVNKLSLAISTYLFYANTYQFTVLEGKNNARNALRKLFDTDDLQYLVLLKERLDSLPIPPRLFNEMAHLYTIYHTSEHSPTSPTYSFTPMTLSGSPSNITALSTSDTTQGIKYCLSANVLSDTTFVKVCDMMARVLPEWVDVKVGTSQLSAHIYDADHLNVFVNSPGVSCNFIGGSTQELPTPQYSGTESDHDCHYVVFNAHGRNVRGDQQALWSALSSDAIDETWSGFLVPVASVLSNYPTNRYKYTSVSGGGERWFMDNYDPGNTTIPRGSAIYANTYDAAILQKTSPIGSYRLLGMGTESQRIPQDEYLSFILDINMSPGSSNRSSKERYKGKKRRGK